MTHLQHDLDLLPFDSKINGIPEIVVDHVRVKFDDPSCIGFLRRVEKQMNTTEHPIHMATVGMSDQHV